MNSKRRDGRTVRISPEKRELIDGLPITIERVKDYYVARVRVNQGLHRPRLHRIIMDVYDPDILVDHKDGDSLNCTDENLRTCNHTENNWNSRKRTSNTTSKYKGVAFDKVAGMWKARFYAYKKQICLGYFHSEEEAALAYNAKALEVAGEFAKVNDVQV